MCRIKRTLSLTIAIIMVFSLLPLQVFAVEMADDENHDVVALAETVEETIEDGKIDIIYNDMDR